MTEAIYVAKFWRCGNRKIRNLVSDFFFCNELGALKIKNVRFITFKYTGINNDCFLSYLIFVIILYFVITPFRFGLCSIEKIAESISFTVIKLIGKITNCWTVIII